MTAQTRAISAVTGAASPAAPGASGPVLAYGPDDPGYGPPGPDWYRATPEEPEMAKAATVRDASAEPVAIRSPFEPLPRTRPASERAGDGDAAGQPDEPDDRELDGYQMAAYQSAIDDDPDDIDADLAGPQDGALGQLRNLYASAQRITPETAGADDGDRQLEALLARQRQLISEYFRDSSPRDASTTTGPGPGSGSGLGADSGAGPGAAAGAAADDTLVS